MKRDLHGMANLMLGTLLVLITGIYSAAIPSVALAVMALAGAFLIGRECWLHGGRVQWSFTSRKNN